MYNSALVLKKNVYTADFETTALPNLQVDGYVRVVLWSLVNVESKQSYYGFDIASFLTKLIQVKAKIVYFHNLKFDGNFIVYYFLKNNIGFELIAPQNIWYAIKWNGIEIRDSLKKFRTSVKHLGQMFDIGQKYSDKDESGLNLWDYYVPHDFVPSQKDIEYCIQDSKIVAFAVEKEWDAGRHRLTQSSEAYYNCKKNLPNFNQFFPKISSVFDNFFRDGPYRGGVCAVNELYQNQELEGIYGYDVNGLYGYVMDETLLPFGMPYYGEPISQNDLYVVDFECEFEVKKGMFPFLQIKRNLQYLNRDTEYLKESDGPTHLRLTSVDYELFKKHYYVYNENGNEYMSVQAMRGLLHPIIQENIRQKEYYSKGAHYNPYLRSVAKYNTNMLYGSFALSTISDKCKPFIGADGAVKIEHEKGEKDGRYIPYATFVTANARKITITAIQENYSNWIYSDTDSMYLLKPAKGIKIDPKKSGAWKYETFGDFVENWDGEPFPKGKFLRPKTYCLADENKNIYKKYYPDGSFESELRCAGMPDTIKESVKWDDFHIGAVFEGKLLPRTVPGGVCLIPTTYQIMS